MLFGRARLVTDTAEKEARLKAFFEGMYPGRWDILRPIEAQERKATAVLALPISEASAKLRVGGPNRRRPRLRARIWAVCCR